MEKQNSSSGTRPRTARSSAPRGSNSGYEISGQLIARARRRALWAGRIVLDDDQVERFNALVSERGPGDCWPWLGKRATDGSGRFYVGRFGGGLAAHRLAYRLRVAPIGEGMRIVRSCFDRGCCNPAHLVQKSPRELHEDGVRSGRLKPFVARRREVAEADIEFRVAIVLESLRERTSLPALCRRECVPRAALRGWRKEFVDAGRERLAELRKPRSGGDPVEPSGSSGS